MRRQRHCMLDARRLGRLVALCAHRTPAGGAALHGQGDVGLRRCRDPGAARLQPPSVTHLPPLLSELGVVGLRGRSPSPMARLAIESILEVARDPHAQP